MGDYYSTGFYNDKGESMGSLMTLGFIFLAGWLGWYMRESAFEKEIEANKRKEAERIAEEFSAHSKNSKNLCAAYANQYSYYPSPLVIIPAVTLIHLIAENKRLEHYSCTNETLDWDEHQLTIKKMVDGFLEERPFISEEGRAELLKMIDLPSKQEEEDM